MRSRIWAAGAAWLFVTGCLTAFDARLNNQGGGSVLTAGAKVINQQLSTLTPDELQILVDTAVRINPDINLPPLSDAEAGAFIDFLKANALDSIADFEAFGPRAEQDPDSVVIPDSVRALGEDAEDGNVPPFIQAIFDSGAFNQ